MAAKWAEENPLVGGLEVVTVFQALGGVAR
jgi:hypothetical protein